MLERCDETGIEHPELITESGRATVAHHAVLVVEATDMAPALGPLPDLDTPPGQHDLLVNLAELLTELSEVVGEDGGDPAEPNEVLQQMLREADVIRERLDTGLAAAFEQMEQMQRDAEERAEELLTAARTEADRLRAPGDAPTIQVSLADDEGGNKSRYSKNSASLPRIGEDDGGSVLAQMNRSGP